MSDIVNMETPSPSLPTKHVRLMLSRPAYPKLIASRTLTTDCGRRRGQLRDHRSKKPREPLIVITPEILSKPTRQRNT
ncbi:hypothetical protein TNCV_1672151 [Trichonephila clavipes]|nr:hypothetical protein TNCV_1672151 [Trichonephila clavipes]